MTGQTTHPKSGTPALVKLAERFALMGVWAVLIAGFSFAVPGAFLSWPNFAAMFASYAPSALLALALIIPISAGDFDLSAGATLTLSACMIGVLNALHGLPIAVALAAALAAGAVVGAVNAFFIVVCRIPSLVITLGTSSVLIGVVQWMTNSSTISGISPTLVSAMVGVRLLGVPLAFYYVLLIAALGYYVFEYTPLGRRLLFVGQGREVARLNGVGVDRVRAGSLIASGVMSALAGVAYAGVLGSSDPSSGQNLLLPAFAAAYLGATTIIPGRFNPLGTVAAVYFLATGITGLTMLGVPLWVTNVFNGAALILAVTISRFARGRAAADLA
jgi:ribose transport system permease protein